MGNCCSIQVSCSASSYRCCDWMVSRVIYMRHIEDNLDSLQIELQRLLAIRDDVMRRVDMDELKKMRRTNQVQAWLSTVQIVESEVVELLEVKSQELDKLCLGGYCSKTCNSSFKFAKNVAEKLQVVATLRVQGYFDGVSEKLAAAAVDERPIRPTVGSLESTVDRVWKFLGEEEVGIIGIYGTGGVGKTTLLTKINNKFCETPQDFDFVIWEVVSKDTNLDKIQEDIGKKVGLLDESWKNRSFQDKAQDIFKILSKKKFVLLLDDVWEQIDLTKVGVPLRSSKVASKIMLTARSLEVCGMMNADECIRVDYLGNDEAWELFQHNLGRDVLDMHPDIPQLARTMAKECGGLPLALITVSRAMSFRRTPAEWSYALRVLSKSAYEFEGMVTEVFLHLKFSYDRFYSDVVRSCFLYCSLFPKDYKINKRELIDCWIGENFLDEYNGSELYNQGYYIISILVSACLLEEEEDEIGEDIVKMHKVIRNMALWITCDYGNKQKSFVVQAGVDLTEAPEVEKWKGVTRMSLMENRIENMSEIPTCPDLQTLFLNDNYLNKITSKFFRSMSSLKVLNLSNNRSLTDLPSGISELVSLQYLNLSRTLLTELPIELKPLVNLKCLSLEYTWQLCVIPHQLISSFSKLNVLRMAGCGLGGAKEDSVLFGGGELLVEELVCLKYLNVLTINLRSAHALQRFLSSIKLQSHTRSIFLHHLHDSKSLSVSALADLKQLHTLNIIHCEDLEEMKFENVQKDIETVEKTLPAFYFLNLQTVEISWCFKLRELTWLVFVPNLKFLSVLECDNIEDIICAQKLHELGEMVANRNPFSKLQSLQLVFLPNLRSIYWKALPFPHLKQIAVTECPKLKKLPLGSNSAKENKIVIEGDDEWLKELQWEDEATLNAFLPCLVVERAAMETTGCRIFYDNA